MKAGEPFGELEKSVIAFVRVNPKFEAAILRVAPVYLTEAAICWAMSAAFEGL